MSVKVLIPFYKNEAQLDTCKAALKGQIDPRNIVVYNDSETKLGFTGAVNTLLRGVLKDSDDYLVILNQDCYLKPKAIKKMVEFMDNHPKCAIGGIKHFSKRDNNTITHGGCTLAFPNGMHLGGYVDKGDCAENKQMPWVNGACLIVRTDSIIDFGLMDENFEMICSDSDWCYTARDRGWEVWYIADAECVHEHGISRGTTDNVITKKKLLDTIRFRDKWLTDGAYKELIQEIF